MNITENYLSRADMWMLITTLTYFLMNGAQLFETAVLVPKWTANPPESFSYLIDRNGASLKTFWIVFHSLHELTFILAIVFCWKIMPIRNGLLILFAVHFAVRVWTLSYFAPNIIEFQKIAEGLNSATDLVKRANVWKTLNYVRVGLFIAVSIGFIPLLWRLLSIKPN
ncbi:transposase [Fluviicola chungangensis]|uniref:Transposase n=1 Tax=Fluviicola chungangensis TaxID=2597671 RepID=A0A556MQL5_9FLAO|nr:transposase [Fluviicola chungangensis]TSJ42098.1 transposase [Fluviicola chungangensis]